MTQNLTRKQLLIAGALGAVCGLIIEAFWLTPVGIVVLVLAIAVMCWGETR